LLSDNKHCKVKGYEWYDSCLLTTCNAALNCSKLKSHSMIRFLFITLLSFLAVFTVKAQICSDHVADDFNSSDYGGNIGSDIWTSHWTENNNGGPASDPDGPLAGLLRNTGNLLSIEGVAGADPFIYREANLSGTSNAELCFDVSSSGNLDEVTDIDQLSIEVSPDGGSTWVTLEIILGDVNDQRCYDISAYASINTQVRFYASAYVNAGNEHYYIENVSIAYDAASSTSVYGYAWEDWNFNGIYDETCPIPVEGVEVEVWGCDDTLLGSTTTSRTGAWSFDIGAMGLCSDSDGLCDGTLGNGCIRVEYNIPTALCHLKATQFGANNGTTVQYLKVGECAPIGLARKDDYCETNDPELITSCYSTVLPESTTNEPAVVYWNRSNIATDSYTTAAHFDDVGSIWGIGYNNKDDEYYYASLVKRHTGLGPDGIGAIYVQTDVTNPSSVSLLYDFGAAAGSISSNTVRGLTANVGDPSYDTEAFWKTGKEGLGDLEYCSDTGMLYVVNLNDQTVYQIDPSAASPSASPLGAMPWFSNNPCWPFGGTVRPWALKKHNKKLYVGVVCDAGLTAHVYCYDLESQAWNTNPRLTADLTYNRQASNSFDGNPDKGSGAGAEWHAWEDNYNNWNDFQNFGSYSQPIFADIEFDDNGDMILGFMDRGSLQMGRDNYRPEAPYGPGGTELVNYVNAGDILRAGILDSSSDPTFGLENDGITSGINKTKISQRPSREFTMPYQVGGGTYTVPYEQPSGPGGLEFYFGDRAYLSYDPGFRAQHHEVALGALAIIRGSGELINTTMDPQYSSYPVNTQGVNFLSNTTGELLESKRLSSTATTNLGKAIALGDIEICCAPPPIQIGNFVWIDLDEDGIQDPCEPPVVNALVSLYIQDALGCCSFVSSVNTDANGQYYFDNVDPNTDYTVVVGDASSWSTTDNELTYNGTQYEITSANQSQAGNVTNPDAVDSDGVLSTNACCQNGYPSTTVTTGEPGDNDHTLDFGFVEADVCGDLSKDD